MCGYVVFICVEYICECIVGACVCVGTGLCVVYVMCVYACIYVNDCTCGHVHGPCVEASGGQMVY